MYTQCKKFRTIYAKNIDLIVKYENHGGASAQREASRAIRGCRCQGGCEQPETAVGQSERIEIVPFGITVIHPDEDAVFHFIADINDLYARLLERRVSALLPGRDVHAVEQEVFVAAFVVNEEDLARIRRPEGLADRSLLFLR